MDESTDGVTLHASLLLTVVEPFRATERLCAPLFEMVEHLRNAEPESLVPMALYNDACGWIERNLGAANARAAGQATGRKTFTKLRREGAVGWDTAPPEALAALSRAVRVAIQDPRKRGWELLEQTDGRVLVRRTQTFNCVMQEGVLLALVEATRVVMPRVEHVRCTRNGDTYCEYEVRWLPKRQTGTMPAVKP